MAARPEASSLIPMIDRAYHTAMLVVESLAISTQWARSTRSECPCRRATRANTTRPPAIVTVLKVKAGKSATPIFMIGQLSPQMRVSRHRRKVSRRDSVLDILLYSAEKLVAAPAELPGAGAARCVAATPMGKERRTN